MRKGKLLNKFESHPYFYTDDIVFVKDDPVDVDSYMISKTEDFICCNSVFKEDIELLDEDEVNNVDPVQSSIPEQCYLKVDNPSYSSLKRVLDMAYDQASSGKGKERHANDDNFEDQPICQIPRYQGSIDFVTGQAVKKCLEVTKLPTVDAKVRELLGAINYIAAGIIVLQEGSNNE